MRRGEWRGPSWARALLTWIAPASERDRVLDDFDEAFARRSDEEGLARARRRYVREVVQYAIWGVPRAFGHLVGATGSIAMDARYALRGLRMHPGFTVVALLTLSLGIGANTAIYSVAETVFLQAPPVRDPGSLVAVYTSCRAGSPRCSSSYPDYEDYRSASALDDLAAWSTISYSVGEEGGPPAFLTTYLVTGNYFDLLGVVPAEGRLLQPGDHDVYGPVPVGVLAYDTWRDRFGSDPAVVGRTLRMNGVAVEVVGVAPEAFRGTQLTGDPDLFLPMATGSLMGTNAVGQPGIFEGRGNRWISGMVGRLAPGADSDRLQAEMDVLAQTLNQTYPDERGTRFTTVDPLARYALPEFAREDLARIIFVMAGVVGFTLLLGCANLANLLLARASSRRREMGLRIALGAGAGRLVRQGLTESLTLSLLGSVGGLGVAMALLELLGRYSLPGGVVLDEIGVGLDSSVLLAGVVLAVATALAFGLVPALHAARAEATGGLRAETARTTEGERRLRSGLVAAQVALCLVLVLGSGLFLRSLQRSLSADLGYRPEGLALARFDLGTLGYEEADAQLWMERVRERLSTLPGVESVTYSTRIPLQVGGGSATFGSIVGYDPTPDEEIRIEYVTAGPDFLRTVGLEVSEGQDPFAPGAAARGVLVNEVMAGRYWSERGSAAGGQLTLSDLELRVVGVVGDARWSGVDVEPANHLLLPYEARPDLLVRSPVTVAVRTTGDPVAFLADLRRELLAAEPDLPFFFVQTAEDMLGATLTPQRMGALLFSAFALLAVVLAALGIGGVVAYAVTRSRRDIGLRLAIGASRRSVVAGAVGRLAVPLAIGLAVGLLSARLLGGTIQAFLIDVQPSDPVVLVAGSAALVAVAMLAAWIPARAAARVHPMEVLKEE